MIDSHEEEKVIKKIDVVVVTYNRLPLLKECITALLSQKQNLSSIHVINNHSQDGTNQYLESLKNNRIVKVHNLTKNVGGAKGFEIGVSKALQSPGEFVWIMDDDTIPKFSASDNLLTAISKLKGNFGFVCSNVKWKDGSGMNMPDPTAQWTTLSDEYLIGVTRATFVSLLVKKSVIKKVGFPIGEMKIWGDDTEYTTRISKRFPCYLVTNSVVIHKSPIGFTNEGIINTSEDRISRIEYAYRNNIYIARKYYSKKKVIKLVLRFCFDAISCIKVKNKKFIRFKNVIIGVIKGFFFNPTVSFPNEQSNKI